MATEAAVLELVRQVALIAQGQADLNASIRLLVDAQVQRSGVMKRDGSVMDLKAFQKLQEFKGQNYLAFKRKLQALVKKVHGEVGIKALRDAEVLADTSTENLPREYDETSNDLEAAFHFLLEGEPSDIAANCENGLTTWKKLHKHYSPK